MNFPDIEKKKKIAQHLSSIMMQKEHDGESPEFKEWLASNKEASKMLENFSKEEYLSDAYDKFNSYDENAHLKAIERKLRAKTIRKTVVRITSFAAAVIALSLLIWNSGLKQEDTSKNINQVTQLSLTPSTKVLLIVDNGDTLSLDAKLAENEKLLGVSANESEITYNKPNGKIVTNRLIVPRGNSNITVGLADGSSVILNADSELEYPSYFSGDKREVKLKGEAYFKVTKSKETPFIVHVDDMQVTVYGTEFNINSYDSNIIETLLIEGSVGVKHNSNTKPEVRLKPNQMLLGNKQNAEMELKYVDDIGRYISWMSGSFIYKADSLGKVLNDLSRYYNINFRVRETSKSAITAEFSKDSDVTEIIKSLEITTGLKIDILPMKIEK